MEHDAQVLYRILSGKIRVDYNGFPYIIHNPSIEDKFVAEEIYNNSLRKLKFLGVLSRDQIIQSMSYRGLWSQEMEDKLSFIKRDIEETKINIFTSYFKTHRRESYRQKLVRLLEQEKSLYSEKFLLDIYSAEFAANIDKFAYIYSKYVTDLQEKPVTGSSHLLDSFHIKVLSSIPGETQIRRICRTDPWRSMYSSDNLNLNSEQLTNEQINLLTWSRIYKNVQEHLECPPEDVINDDHALDGWMILERRKTAKRQVEKTNEDSIKSDKIKNAGEVFVMANTQEDANKVYTMNDINSKMRKDKKINYIVKKGSTTNEGSIPSVIQEMQMKAVENTAKSIKQRKG